MAASGSSTLKDGSWEKSKRSPNPSGRLHRLIKSKARIDMKKMNRMGFLIQRKMNMGDDGVKDD